MRFFATTVALLLSACVSVQHNAPQGVSEHNVYDVRYYELIALIKESASLEVFKALRNAYVDTSLYDPYFGPEHTQTQNMFQALGASAWSDCVRWARKMLDTNYISLSAHYGSMVCWYEAGEQLKGDYHKYVLNGLVDAIHATGDGMSLESAFYCTSAAELYAYLDLHGLKKVEQALIHHEGKSYDLMTVRDPDSGAELELYFDITAQWTRGFRGIK